MSARHMIPAVVCLAAFALATSQMAFADSVTAQPATLYTVAPSAPHSIAVTTAQEFYAALHAKYAKDMKKAHRHHRHVVPITGMKRIESFPARLLAPARDIIDHNHNGRLDRPTITFWTGAADTAACLTLIGAKAGSVSRGRCGRRYQPLPTSITYSYTTLVETLIWFDQHTREYRGTVYANGPRNASLIKAVIDADVAHSAVAVMTTRNGQVTNGVVTLNVAGTCGTAHLPTHNPNGTSYSASITYSTC